MNPKTRRAVGDNRNEELRCVTSIAGGGGLGCDSLTDHFPYCSRSVSDQCWGSCSIALAITTSIKVFKGGTIRETKEQTPSATQHWVRETIDGQITGACTACRRRNFTVGPPRCGLECRRRRGGRDSVLRRRHGPRGGHGYGRVRVHRNVRVG